MIYIIGETNRIIDNFILHRVHISSARSRYVRAQSELINHVRVVVKQLTDVHEKPVIILTGGFLADMASTQIERRGERTDLGTMLNCLKAAHSINNEPSVN